MRAAISTEVDEELALMEIRKFDFEPLYNGEGTEVPVDFQEGLRLCQFSASKNADDIQNLNCIFIRDDSMYSGDGYRATRVTLGSSMEGEFLIPSSSAMQLSQYAPDSYVFSNGWMHFMDSEDTIFSLRTVDGDYPETDNIFDNFKGEDEIELPSSLKTAVDALGGIVDSAVDSFKVISIEINKGEIECNVEKNGVNVTKLIPFEDNETEATFMISSPMLSAVLEVNNIMQTSKNLVKFQTDISEHIIVLVQ